MQLQLVLLEDIATTAAEKGLRVYLFGIGNFIIWAWTLRVIYPRIM